MQTNILPCAHFPAVLFEEKKILFIDDLKFRERSNKKELSRDSLDLISNYKGKTQFVHKCELSSLQNFKKKYYDH